MNEKTRSQSLICVEHLTKTVKVEGHYLTILKDLSLTIESGESLAIVGVSGSGKSTLLGLMAGLDLPTKGRVMFDGINLCRLSENNRALLRARNIGFVFQSFQLLSNFTALENVMLPLELKGEEDAKEKGLKLLEMVGLGERAAHYPRQLSGGEQQRVGIARAFATKPRVLFADEPTGNLDQKTASQIIHLLFELNRKLGTTLVCVTHDPALGERCNRLLQLAGGQLVQ